MKPAGLAETVGGLAAGFQAFLLRSEALKRFGSDRDSFLKCFWAPTLAYPLYLMAMLQIDPTVQGLDHAPGFTWFVARTSTYVIALTLWPIILDIVCERLGKQQAWIPLVVAGVWIGMTPMLASIAMVFYLDPYSPILTVSLFGIKFWMLVVNTWLLRRFLGIGLPFAAALAFGKHLLVEFLRLIEAGILFAAM